MAFEHHLKTAYAYLYIRDFESARRAFDQAIDEEPLNPECYFHASVTALRNEEIGYAESAARQAVVLDPENPVYLLHLGAVQSKAMVRDAKAAIQEGRRQEARGLLVRAIEANPLCETAHQLLCELE